MAASAKLLPVAIMAHNEEEVIAAAVRSVLRQKLPPECSLQVLVVANACTDHTEAVVRDLQRETDDRVVLLSVSEKGKARAINRAIRHVDALSLTYEIQHVVLIDADTEFVDDKALLGFSRRFAAEPDLAAVAATPVPDAVFDSRRTAAAKLYRAMYAFRSAFRSNVLSGMCYAITLDSLRRVNLPELQITEDIYIGKRLSGRFVQDFGIRVAYKIPRSLRLDLERRTRQEVVYQQTLRCLDRLRASGERVRLFDSSLGPAYEYLGVGLSRAGKLGHWLSLRSADKVWALLYGILLGIANVRAGLLLRRQAKSAESDVWTTRR